MLTNSKDIHYREGLKKDTTEKRRDYLSRSEMWLTKFVKKQTDVHTLAIPRGMGMSGGLVTKDWEKIYLAMYQKLAEDLLPYSIKMVILDSVGKMMSIKCPETLSFYHNRWVRGSASMADGIIFEYFVR